VTITLTPVVGAEAYDLIFPDHLAMLSKLEQETMHRAMKNSAQSWICYSDDDILCTWGLIAPTLLSDRAYLWMYNTIHMKEHIFCVVRHSQRAIDNALKYYPIIVGHCKVDAKKSIRWVRWLGAEFGTPQDSMIPFEIRAK
jgi:hypothetical protein